MATRNFVYSTLSTGNTYVVYRKAENDLQEVVSKIVIKGGANVANALTTPRGVVTEVTESQLAELMSNELFKTHMKNGFISVDTRKVDPEVQAAKGMKLRDNSSQIVPQDYREGDGQAKPMEGEAKKKGFLDGLLGRN